MNVITPFVEIIGIQFTNNFDNNLFYQRALEIKKTYSGKTNWKCDTYSTIKDLNLMHDKTFEELIQKCTYHVKEFAELYGIFKKNISCKESWLNIASTGQYQEYHLHPKHHFSLVYYVKTPENCGNIVFKSKSADNMFPLPEGVLTDVNNATYDILPEEGKILIFDSSMLHMVEKNKSEEDRVSVAMNFIVDD